MFGEVVPHGEHALDRPICPKGGVGCWVLWAAGGRARAVEEESGGGDLGLTSKDESSSKRLGKVQPLSELCSCRSEGTRRASHSCSEPAHRLLLPR